MSTTEASARNLKPAIPAKKRKVRVWENSRGDRQTVKQGWSWPAFVFGIFWFGYKKIWIETVMIAAGAAFVAGMAIAAGASLDAEMGILLPIVALAHVVFGMFGNKIWERNLVERNYRSTNRPTGNRATKTSALKSDYASDQSTTQSIPTSDLIGGDSENTATNPEVTDEISFNAPVAQQKVSESLPTPHNSPTPQLNSQQSPDQNDSAQTPAQPRVKIPSPVSTEQITTDQQSTPAKAMSMQELETMFGVTPVSSSELAHAPQVASEVNAEPEAEVPINRIDSGVSHPSNETASMLGIETSTHAEKYETIAWMEITSGNVEPELWDAVNVESDDEDSAQNNYVVRRVSQLQFQQGDVAEHQTQENQTSAPSNGTTHTVEANSDAEDIHSGFINTDHNGIEGYKTHVDTLTTTRDAASPTTLQSSAQTPMPKEVSTKDPGTVEPVVESMTVTDDQSGLNLNHVKRIVRATETDSSFDRSQSTLHDEIQSNGVMEDFSRDRSSRDTHAVPENKSHESQSHETKPNGTESNLNNSKATSSAAIVSAIAGDSGSTDNSDSGDSDNEFPEHARRQNALSFIQDHLQRLDEQQQPISTEELKRLLWSADCELIENEDSLKIKDWDGNLIPSANRASISRTISYLIWTHYSDSRDHP